MKNALKFMVLFLVMGVAFVGCTTPKEDVQNTNQNSTSLTQDNKTVQKDVKRIGKPTFGFVDIPSNWVQFKDVDVTSPIMQYSDLAGQSIITLNAGKKGANDARTIANSIWTDMENEGAQNIKGATVKLGGNTAYQVYGTYPKEGKELVTWSFEGNDGYMHYVSVEGPTDSVTALVGRTEKTFALDK